MNSVMDSSIENAVPPRDEVATNSEGKMVLIKSYVQEYIDNCTLHGITHAFRGSTKLRRVIWFMAFITCFGLCFHNISFLLIRFLSLETATKSRVFSPDQLVFPAVTICNYNTFLNSKMSIRTPEAEEEKLKEEPKADEEVNITHYLNEFGHQMGEDGMLLDCRWNGVKCDSKNFTTNFENTVMGLCHTFNSGRPGYPLLSASGPGESGGLKLTLNVQTYEYLENTPTVGLKVRVHGQHEPSVIGDLGFAVAPGTKTLVSVKKKQLISLPAPFATNCTKVSVKYSKAACLNTCKSVYISKICDPKLKVDQDPQLFLRLWSTMMKCYLGNQARFQTMSKQKCSCQEACNRTSFETDLSYALFKKSLYAEVLNNVLNKSNAKGRVSKDFVGENVVELWIFYKELSYEQIEDIEAYPFLSFFAEAGGTLGVYLGASLLTLMEVVELISRVLPTCLSAKKQ